jgi:hypothetical protein
MRNLNTHSAYLQLREIRAGLRKQGKPVTGEALARGLSRYSTRGQAYIDEIQAMIRHNQLSEFNHADLRRAQQTARTTERHDGAGLFASQRRNEQNPASAPRENP